MAVLSELCVVLKHLNVWIVGLNHNTWMFVCVVLYVLCYPV
jgi:hypothetical protein